MELLPLGPGAVHRHGRHRRRRRAGRAARRERTRQVFDRTDVGVLVAEAGRVGRVRGGDPRASCASAKMPVDRRLQQVRPRPRRRRPCSTRLAGREDRRASQTAAPRRARASSTCARRCSTPRPEDFINAPPIVGDLVPPGELAVLVVPIDQEAPKGRLILPQVQTIRDLLDGDAYCLVVKERELRDALDRLNAAAGAGGHRLAGLPEGRRRHAARRAADLASRSSSPGTRATSTSSVRGRAGHRAPAARRPRPDRRGLHATTPSATTSAG